MKVWVIHHIDYDEIDIAAFETNVAEVPMVKHELELLTGSYADEKNEFLASIERMRNGGRENAYIEERLNVSLQEVI